MFFPVTPNFKQTSVNPDDIRELSFDKNYRPFDKMLACVTCFKLFSLAYKIYFEQSKVDIFFIDWETPKMF